MRSKSCLLIAACAALGLTACASTPDLTTSRTPSKRDLDNCTRSASQVVENPDRRNSQTAVAVGSAIGGGLIGLVVVAAAQGADDKAVEAKVRNDCLARRGYKLVPVKPKES